MITALLLAGLAAAAAVIVWFACGWLYARAQWMRGLDR